MASYLHQGLPTIFFSAYAMARELLLSLVDEKQCITVDNTAQLASVDTTRSLLLPSGDSELLLDCLKQLPDAEKYLLFVKNFENYDHSFWQQIHTHPMLLLSGSLDACSYGQELLDYPRHSKIIFSPTTTEPMQIPSLQKYESYFWSSTLEGILRSSDD
ncbi:MAG: hypothetical protein H6765_04695 [Candidatus Peribacteria bacterium]|nr:MAG: hypothetical protein H6765_04695 [Candidatus Peribacteria bacterium]